MFIYIIHYIYNFLNIKGKRQASKAITKKLLDVKEIKSLQQNDNWYQRNQLIEQKKIIQRYIGIQSALHICGFRICEFNQPQIESIPPKTPESSKKQNLNLLTLTTIYIAFTLYEVL